MHIIDEEHEVKKEIMKDEKDESLFEALGI
jgi:hypothetical protein